ncbi:MAG: hypothetical protein OQK55_00885, partial [Thermoanaerobaculales bacterium]|nr:hypothetical protein [Thermoanaerobaculales bacterium]
GDCNDTIHVDYVPMKRQRVHEAEFDLSILEPTGVTARGRRLAPKPVSKVRRIRAEGNGDNGGNGGDEKPFKDGEDVALPFD